MANVNLGQLNKPGFQSSLSSKTGGSRIVAKNLTSAKNTALFKGIKVTGQWGTQNLAKANYQSARFSLNAGKGMPPRMSGMYGLGNFGSMATNYNVQNGSKAFAAGSVLGTGLSIAMGILNKTGVLDFGNSTVQRASDQLSQGLSTPVSISANNSDVALSISNMASCSDKAKLTGAITEAKTQLSIMEAQSGLYDAAAQTAKDEASKFGTQLKTAQTEQKDAANQVGTCKNSVTAATKGRDQALAQVKTGNEQYDKAVENYTKAHDAHVDAQNAKTKAEASANRAASQLTQAQTATQTAQTAYDKCPDQIDGPDGTKIPNPQKQILKQQLDQAKIAEKNAETAKKKADDELQNAKQKESETKTAEEKALNEKKTAYEGLGEAKSKAAAAEKSLQTEQDKLDKTKENLTKAEQNVDATNEKCEQLKAQIDSQNGIVQMAKAHKKDISTLNDAISEQEKRLKTMPQNE